MTDDDQATAARAYYDSLVERYVDFTGTDVSEATEGPIDRALLTAFVEMVHTSGGTRAVDVGCGPGRVAAYLAAGGLEVTGVDVSPAMLAAARRAHPMIDFAEGRLDDIPVADRSTDAVVCWYSIIHTRPGDLPAVFAELRRVLTVGGLVLVAFQAGAGEAVVRNDAQGTGLRVTNHRHGLDDVTRRLTAAGLEIRSTTQRATYLDHETTSQAFVIAGVDPHGGNRPDRRDRTRPGVTTAGDRVLRTGLGPWGRPPSSRV